MNGLNRFMGCMLGGAVGDALGFVIGKDDLKTIHKKYGPYGLRTVLKSAKNGNKSIISDDTQLALFTADGMLFGPTTTDWNRRKAYTVLICAGTIRRRNASSARNRKNG